MVYLINNIVISKLGLISNSSCTFGARLFFPSFPRVEFKQLQGCWQNRTTPSLLHSPVNLGITMQDLFESWSGL